MRYSRQRIALRIVGGIVALLILFAAAFSGVYFLISLLYQGSGQQPGAFAIQLASSLLGLVLVILLMAGLSWIGQLRHRHRPESVFGPIIEAMERIAKGDFRVRVDDTFRDNRLVGDLAKSVNSMAVELERLEQMRQEFVSNVSHEIQSPLTSIRGFAQALRETDLSTDERRHYLAIIETESTRLSRLADNLLRLASLDSEQLKLQPRAFRLDRQIRELILASEPQWSGKGIEMNVSLDEVSITGDDDLLSQVWSNLIHNAVKFTPSGGSVCASLHRHGDRVEFRISDTGIGISEEDQARVFERFYKADRSRDRTREGSGLGLSIAKKIVEMHRGTIELESKPGAGTTFVVSLPSE